MELEKLNQLKTQAQHSSDFLITKVQHLTDSFTKINQKTAKHSVALQNSQKCLDYLDILLDSLKTSQREEKLITRGVGTDVQPFLDSLNRIQNAIKILSENPWKGSEKNIVSLRQLRKVGLLQLSNLFMSKIRQVSEPLDIPTIIRNGAEDQAIVEDEALEFIQKLAATIYDGSADFEFSKDFHSLRAKFIYESLLPLGPDAFVKRGSIGSEPKSPTSSGYIDQFPSMMEWSAIIFQNERKFADCIFRVASVVHKTFDEITKNAFDLLNSSVELAIRDLKEMKKQKAMAGFLIFLQNINGIRSDFRMIINSFEGITEKQNIIIKNEQHFLQASGQFFDPKINENPSKPQQDGTIHEGVHLSITFIRKLLEHDQNVDEWVELFVTHHQNTSEYLSSLLAECCKLIDDSAKYFQHDLHRRVFALNNLTFIQNVINENTTLKEYVNDATAKLITTKFHSHFDGYLTCWSIVEKSIEEARKTLEEKAFKDKSKQIYSYFEDAQKLQKAVRLIDPQLRSMLKSSLKDKLMLEYNAMSSRYS
eukprot:NODE_46_length_32145_cov_0.918711.p6 type:complete len:536 gc:universal NODE_46_length_32145_cov_0.918711:27192-25585(-)